MSPGATRAGRLLIVTAVDLERDAMAESLGASEKVQVGPYEALAGPDATILAGGVGPAAAAAATATALALAPQAYALAVSAGIAGGFRGCAGVGDVVEATVIVAADLGAESPDGFLSLAVLGFGSGEVVAAPLGISGAKRGPVLTVSTVTGSEERARDLAGRGGFAEAMEGFGVAEAAMRHGVPVGELRAISNEVGLRDAGGWDIGAALAGLRAAARELPGGAEVTEGPLELAFSPCPNDTFVFHALVAGQIPGAAPVEPFYADIDVLNQWAAAGSRDIIKVSYAALPPLLADYALLPSGGALGRGCGPLVVTAGRDSLAGARVAIPGRETTAYLLFRLWAQDQGVASIDVLPFDKIMPAVAEGSVDAGLIIHESRFTYPSYGLQSIVDLGDWWEAHTGLAIPLGAIVARRSFGGERLARLAADIRASVEAAWADPAASREYVLAHSQEMAPEVVDQHIALYVNAFTADLGEEGYAAVTGLLDRAVAAGLTGPLTGPLR